MYRKCTTEKAASQQHRFQEALLFSMKSQSYSQITVTDLCRQTGLSRKTFYRLYENKDDVLCAMLDGVIYKMAQHQGANRTLHEDLHRVFTYWKEQKEVLDVLSSNHQTYLLLERALSYISSEDAETQRAFGVAEHPHKDEILLFVLGGIMSLIIRWHHSDYAKSTEEMVQLGAKLLTYPPLQAEFIEEIL